jgi:hypothetical protein
VSHGYDYYGTVVNTAARTEAIAHGGQVMMTEGAYKASGIEESRVTLMGALMLRGVPDPVIMYQLTTVPNRVFPPLRGQLADEGENSSTDVRSQRSAVSGHNKSASTHLGYEPSTASFMLTTAALNQKTITYNVLSAAMVVLPQAVKENLLQNLCSKWHVYVGDVPAGMPQSDAMLEALSSKLAQIMLHKAGMSATGAVDPFYALMDSNPRKASSDSSGMSVLSNMRPMARDESVDPNHTRGASAGDRHATLGNFYRFNVTDVPRGPIPSNPLGMTVAHDEEEDEAASIAHSSGIIVPQYLTS